MITGRVLIVDDDPHLLLAMKRQFKGVFEVVTAPSGRDAIAAVQAAKNAQASFSVVLCDMRMPGLNGVETLEKIRAIAPDTVRIMLTGNADQRTAIEAINRGSIFRFLSKPCDPAELADGIKAAIHQHHLLRADQLLAENEERWRLALAAVGDGVWDWDLPSGQMLFSEGWYRILGYQPIERPFLHRDWIKHVHPEERTLVAGAFKEHLKGKTSSVQCECRLLCSDGTYKWILIRGVALRDSGLHGPVRIIGTGADISERKAMEETLRRQAEELELLATTDSLTGLWNRRCFLCKLEEEMARVHRNGLSMSVVMIDIDFFKQINDAHGHIGGDTVLRHFADALRDNIRKTDMVGRLGGEEFALLLPETAIAQAKLVAEELRRKIAETVITLADQTTLTVTASMGVAGFPGQAHNVTALLHDADLALYEAKNSGRNRII